MPTSPSVRRLYALVPCAGSGVRAGGTTPKQYVEVAGRSLVAHTLASLVGVQRLSRILVVVAPEDAHYERLAAMPSDPRLSLARCGGSTRALTVAGGLAKLAAHGALANDWVLVHDAARCLVRTEWIDALVDACRGDGIGGLLALPVADTLKRAEGDRAVATVSRDNVWQAQTPQMFRFGVLADALARSPDATDEAAAIEAIGLRPKLVLGSPENIKVTHPDDFAIAEALLLRRRATESGEPAKGDEPARTVDRPLP
ncbi:MAG: 2-C-methyl-D-erythritol 4-phosphate cytidylyltransferase [Caldimonas sp.]